MTDRRELLAVDAFTLDDRDWLQLICDCGSATEIDVTDQLPRGEQFAVSCSGCGTSHWLDPVPPAR